MYGICRLQGSLTQGPEDHNIVLQMIGRLCKVIYMKLNMTKSKLMRRGKGVDSEEISELELVKSSRAAAQVKENMLMK